ncbi:MAG TPA: hypothetical protein VFC28_08165, partial [Opitutaceae bacterium]|nr:hypothetical protein [Opitutaceae bacterium]
TRRAFDGLRPGTAGSTWVRFAGNGEVRRSRRGTASFAKASEVTATPPYIAERRPCACVTISTNMQIILRAPPFFASKARRKNASN